MLKDCTLIRDLMHNLRLWNLLNPRKIRCYEYLKLHNDNNKSHAYKTFYV
jgi:hypothetical protein